MEDRMKASSGPEVRKEQRETTYPGHEETATFMLSGQLGLPQ